MKSLYELWNELHEFREPHGVAVMAISVLLFIWVLLGCPGVLS